MFVQTRKIQLPLDYDYPASVADRARDVKLCWFLVQEFGVTAIPGSGTYLIFLSKHHPTLKAKAHPLENQVSVQETDLRRSILQLSTIARLNRRKNT